MERRMATLDGNEAAAWVAHQLSEVIAIYPITPSSGMGELSDEWSAHGVRNLWGTVPLVQEMQSEGGAAGAVHGALQTGALTTTFTSSQGLLLMIPNLYKIAGELTPAVIHVAARSLATQALSIFGDHSDVMAARQVGWGMLFSSSVQEVMDLAAIAHAATLECRLPLMHVFDGFRTSHEVAKIERLTEEDLRALVPDDQVRAFRARALNPDHPVLRGAAQNPDTFFQARESVNPYYQDAPVVMQRTMDRFAEIVGRQYHIFDYIGAPDATRILVAMGSGCETIEETISHLVEHGEKVGMIKVRLYRPFAVEAFLRVLPRSVKRIAVLDRTKEPGSTGEPLYQDVVTALVEGSDRFDRLPMVVGGRYGLSSKEFTPAMVVAVFDELQRERPRNHFTVGIHDDVSGTSLPFDPEFSIEQADVRRAIFFGLGSDGTVGANKNTIKIIGESTPFYAQGYFVYDSKKSGSRTVSHLRFGPRPIQSAYLIRRAEFVGVHQFGFLLRFPVLEAAADGATLLINAPYAATEVWSHLPVEVRSEIRRKRLRLHVINASDVAREAGMGSRVNTIMQVAYFALGAVLPRDEAIAKIKESIKKTYGKRGEAVVEQNFRAVDATLAHLYEVDIPAVDPAFDRSADAGAVTPHDGPMTEAEEAAEYEAHVHFAAELNGDTPEFVRHVTSRLIQGDGDSLPVSAIPADGTWPTGTARFERRDIATEVPIWDTDLCIQCGKCVMVCPHAVIRAKVVREEALVDSPPDFKTAAARWREMPGARYTIQVSTEDCTGCSLCVEICPAHDKEEPSHRALEMQKRSALRQSERSRWDFFLSLPDRALAPELRYSNIKNLQLLQPRFEFPGACAGCGETAYLKLLSQLYGDRALVANATGCSSIFGGNLPTTPWSKDKDGRGPAWSNSLFEDNAEFGLGMRLSLDKQEERTRELLVVLREWLGERLVDEILHADPHGEGGMDAQRHRIVELKETIHELLLTDPAPLREAGEPVRSQLRDLLGLAEVLVPRSVWIVGGDGWAYDIGFGGVDHVLASGRNVNLLVLDTEVYSNTGGQASKSTPLGAVARFAAAGKTMGKKDLGWMAMTYGNVYVAQIAMGGSDTQTLKAFLEAEAHPGPSLIIAYSHCIAHGIEMSQGLSQQELAVLSGAWPLYRYQPARKAAGENPFILDSKPPSRPLSEYIYNEGRYRMLLQSDPKSAEHLLHEAERGIAERWRKYEELAKAPKGEPSARSTTPQ